MTWAKLELVGAVEIGGIENNMIVDMGFIRVCRNDKGVFSFGKPQG